MLRVTAILNFQKVKKELGDSFGSIQPKRATYSLNRCFQLLKLIDLGQLENSQQVYLCEKEAEAISANRNNVIHEPENLGLVAIYEAKSGKESTRDQEVDICNRIYGIATYNMRRMCVTIKKYNLNKPPFFQIRLFTAKEKEDLKQVAHVNYIVFVKRIVVS